VKEEFVFVFPIVFEPLHFAAGNYDGARRGQVRGVQEAGRKNLVSSHGHYLSIAAGLIRSQRRGGSGGAAAVN
jgi:hypothetical protein